MKQSLALAVLFFLLTPSKAQSFGMCGYHFSREEIQMDLLYIPSPFFIPAGTVGNSSPLSPRVLRLKKGSQTTQIENSNDFLKIIDQLSIGDLAKLLIFLVERGASVNSKSERHSLRQREILVDQLLGVISRQERSVVVRLDTEKMFGIHGVSLVLESWEGHSARSHYRFLDIDLKAMGERESKVTSRPERQKEKTEQHQTPTGVDMNFGEIYTMRQYVVEQAPVRFAWFAESIIPALLRRPHGDLRAEDIRFKNDGRDIYELDIRYRSEGTHVKSKIPPDYFTKGLGLSRSRADVYALGIVLYEIMSGGRSFFVELPNASQLQFLSPGSRLEKIKYFPIEEWNPSTPGPIVSILERAFRDLNYELSDMKRDLDRFVEDAFGR